MTMLFVSYSRADEASVGPLVDDVQALGYDVWLDEQLSGGQVWWDEVLQKIRGCDAFLFVLSPFSVSSEACLLELEYAAALDRTIIPVELTATDPTIVPTTLGKHQIVRYGTGDKSAMIAVSRALTHLDSTRPLPDPEPARPPLPGSYFLTLREEIAGRDPLTLEQQLGVLHRVRMKADDPEAQAEVRQLLSSFRRRDDLYASVAEQIDALRTSLVPPPAPTAAVVREEARGRVRTPVSSIDWAVVVLGSAAVLAGLLAMLGSLYTTDRDTTRRWGTNGHDLQRWQLLVLLVIFAGLVVANFTAGRRVRRVGSLLVVAIALFGLVAWWWAAIDDLLGQTYISVGHIALGGGTLFTGVSLGLQIVVGVLMFTAAFPLAGERSATRTP
jgi:hypothetical protein